MIQPIEMPFTALVDTFHGKVPDGVGLPFEQPEQDDIVLATVPESRLSSLPLVGNLLTVLRRQQQQAGQQVFEGVFESVSEGAPIHGSCFEAIGSISAVIDVVSVLVREGVGWAVPEYFDVLEPCRICEGWEVRVPKNAFHASPSLFEKGHTVHRVYPWVESILSGHAPFDGLPESFGTPPGKIIGTMRSGVARQIIMLKYRISSEFMGECFGQDHENAHSIYADRPHRDFLRAQMRRARMGVQVKLLYRLVAMSLIEEPDCKAYAREHPIRGFGVDREFNIVAVRNET